MANYKRGYPRTTGRRTRKSSGNWLKNWPRWHDIVFHNRPHRRATKVAEWAVVRGADADSVEWPVYGKPHVYYW